MLRDKEGRLRYNRHLYYITMRHEWNEMDDAFAQRSKPGKGWNKRVRIGSRAKENNSGSIGLYTINHTINLKSRREETFPASGLHIVSFHTVGNC